MQGFSERLKQLEFRPTVLVENISEILTDAIVKGIARANKTLENVKGAWIEGQKVIVKNGEIEEYRVIMKVTFVLKKMDSSDN